MTPSAALRAFAFLVVAAVPTSSWGHAVLVESIPPHKATLTASPQTVLLRFNAALERMIIQVYLIDRQKTRTPLADVEASKPNEIVVHPPKLPPGVYTILYKVLARDGHVTEGSIRFTVLDV